MKVPVTLTFDLLTSKSILVFYSTRRVFSSKNTRPPRAKILPGVPNTRPISRTPVFPGVRHSLTTASPKSLNHLYLPVHRENPVSNTAERGVSATKLQWKFMNF